MHPWKSAAFGALFLISSLPAMAVTPPGLSRNYQDVKAFLRQVVEQHPNTAQLIEIGLNDAGQIIEGLKIGNGPVRNLLVATHHGNEYGSTEVAKAFAASVAAAPISGQTLIVIPVLNIGGFDARQRSERAGGRAWDPNRDYPGPCGSGGPFRLKSTAALAQLIEREQIVASTTLHTFFPAVTYPWGFTIYDTRFVDSLRRPLHPIVQGRYRRERLYFRQFYPGDLSCQRHF
jgi:carboxypeptidase T